jgi:hypothetical protein
LDSILNRFVERRNEFTFDLRPKSMGLPRKNSNPKSTV